MDTPLIFIIGFVLVSTFLNILASFWIVRDEGLNRFQVLMQMIFIWLIPLIGSIIIISLQWSHIHDGFKPDMKDSNDNGYRAETGSVSIGSSD